MTHPSSQNFDFKKKKLPPSIRSKASSIKPSLHCGYHLNKRLSPYAMRFMRKIRGEAVLKCLLLVLAFNISISAAFQPFTIASTRLVEGVPQTFPSLRYTPAQIQQSYNTKRQINSFKNIHSLQASQLPISFPLVGRDDTWGNIAALCATASVSHQLGKTTSIGRLLGPPVTAMAISFILGSIGILPPGGSGGAKILQLLSIQLATPLLLLGVNIRECRKRCGPLLAAFILASISTIAACLVAFPLCASSLHKALGADGLKIAAALLAKNVGGGLNYVAVCRSLDASANAVAAGLCVDNIFALIYFPITSALAAGRPDVASFDDGDDEDESDTSSSSNGVINAETISASLTVGAVATWLGESIGGQSGALPLATSLTILFTLIRPRMAKSLSSSGEALGTSLLYLFFATAGAPGLSIADSVKAAFVPIGLFLLLLYGIHGSILITARNFILWSIRRKRRQDQIQSSEEYNQEEEQKDSFILPQRLLVASSAAIGGPATAAALAKANQWNSLVAPSLIVGNLGYAVATFAGIAFHTFFKR